MLNAAYLHQICCKFYIDVVNFTRFFVKNISVIITNSKIGNYTSRASNYSHVLPISVGRLLPKLFELFGHITSQVRLFLFDVILTYMLILKLLTTILFHNYGCQQLIANMSGGVIPKLRKAGGREGLKFWTYCYIYFQREEVFNRAIT